MHNPVTPTVANCPAQDPSEGWLQDWPSVEPVLEIYLLEKHMSKEEVRQLLASYRRLIPNLPESPRTVTAEQLRVILRSPSCHGYSRTAWSYVCLLLIERQVWPLTNLLRSTNQDTVKRCLGPRWRTFVNDFPAFLREEGVPRNIWWRWRKWITTFVWWARFAEEDTLDPAVVRRLWDEFSEFLARWTRSSGYTRRATQRAFALFWNFAIRQGRLLADPLPVERVGTTFWGQVQGPLRVLLHHRHALHRTAAADQDVHLYFLVYAVCWSGFSVRHPARTRPLSTEELGRLKTKFQQEHVPPRFLEAVVEELTALGLTKGDAS